MQHLLVFKLLFLLSPLNLIRAWQDINIGNEAVNIYMNPSLTYKPQQLKDGDTAHLVSVGFDVAAQTYAGAGFDVNLDMQGGYTVPFYTDEDNGYLTGRGEPYVQIGGISQFFAFVGPLKVIFYLEISGVKFGLQPYA